MFRHICLAIKYILYTLGVMSTNNKASMSNCGRILLGLNQ
jgi:hypothetical protein